MFRQEGCGARGRPGTAEIRVNKGTVDSGSKPTLSSNKPNPWLPGKKKRGAEMEMEKEKEQGVGEMEGAVSGVAGPRENTNQDVSVPR